jgi:hypothetical protein
MPESYGLPPEEDVLSGALTDVESYKEQSEVEAGETDAIIGSEAPAVPAKREYIVGVTTTGAAVRTYMVTPGGVTLRD